MIPLWMQGLPEVLREHDVNMNTLPGIPVL